MRTLARDLEQLPAVGRASVRPAQLPADHAGEVLEIALEPAPPAELAAALGMLELPSERDRELFVRAIAAWAQFRLEGLPAHRVVILMDGYRYRLRDERLLEEELP